MASDVTNGLQTYTFWRQKLPVLSMVCIAMAIFFAICALITGNRAFSLYDQALQATKAKSSSKTDAIGNLQGEMEKVTASLEAIRKNLKTEKASSERLRKQLSAVMDDLQQAKNELNRANQKIDQLTSIPTDHP
ncbi:hypothetical protein DESC_290111 [Desulfosarcina cetonica]|uniref:hypothetical protein n=1 Tax=Desulfosarcina cetonica TaxID=90730 RepID=UPI0006D0CF3A|nr:hypothetical protein [Desulfosarcina cetonica]VTR65041.1 hypothetical protein DESC_290111 [Desulfosarcina cetonica]